MEVPKEVLGYVPKDYPWPSLTLRVWSYGPITPPRDGRPSRFAWTPQMEGDGPDGSERGIAVHGCLSINRTTTPA